MALRNEDIAARLRQLRNEAGGPTQEIVADAVNVTSRALRTWESAAARPNFRNLSALAGYYGVSVQWILDGGDAPETPDEGSQLDRIEAMLTELLGRTTALETAVEELARK